ncbi:hypothetical protein C0Q70_06945 [Pomacea canaliculata]|uniref:Uncharacterized protein n=1 Tax=Pomacea canaliculata TaxID=400727 RepID=A0A2T7PDN5_POMCA|nr:hypothetical protein C0Q70_06945 [Pomacea canaliculata]
MPERSEEVFVRWGESTRGGRHVHTRNPPLCFVRPSASKVTNQAVNEANKQQQQQQQQQQEEQ